MENELELVIESSKSSKNLETSLFNGFKSYIDVYGVRMFLKNLNQYIRDNHCNESNTKLYTAIKDTIRLLSKSASLNVVNHAAPKKAK